VGSSKATEADCQDAEECKRKCPLNIAQNNIWAFEGI
jgi:hypothetical protein